jgi:hypothetical protein
MNLLIEGGASDGSDLLQCGERPIRGHFIYDRLTGGDLLERHSKSFDLAVKQHVLKYPRIFRFGSAHGRLPRASTGARRRV